LEAKNVLKLNLLKESAIKRLIRKNYIFLLVLLLIVGLLVGLMIYFFGDDEKIMNIFKIVVRVCAPLIFFLLYRFFYREKKKELSKDTVEIEKDIITFKKDKQIIHFRIEELNKIQIFSDCYKGLEVGRQYPAMGILKLVFFDKNNKGIHVNTSLETKEDYDVFVPIIKQWYLHPDIEVEERIHPKGTMTPDKRPLLLSYPGYNELQKLKKELKIKGQYF
jgi:hypothetical protein